jgi:hypothetical protein
MPEPKANSLEYLCEVFMGLSPENKDYILDTARSLLRVQNGKTYPDNSETVPTLDTASAYAGKKKEPQK